MDKQCLEYDVVELSDKDYLLGLVECGGNSRTVNYIFLWAEFYTYRQRLIHKGLLDMYQWIWELLDRLAISNYIDKLEGNRKKKVPSDELICRIHSL